MVGLMDGKRILWLPGQQISLCVLVAKEKLRLLVHLEVKEMLTT